MKDPAHRAETSRVSQRALIAILVALTAVLQVLTAGLLLGLVAQFCLMVLAGAYGLAALAATIAERDLQVTTAVA